MAVISGVTLSLGSVAGAGGAEVGTALAGSLGGAGLSTGVGTVGAASEVRLPNATYFPPLIMENMDFAGFFSSIWPFVK